MKFLVVDDHAMVREGMVAVLRQSLCGGTVLQAADAETAIAVAREHSDLDLVFLDLMMPGLSGVAALAAFVAAHPTTPVIVLSSSESSDDVRAALAAGALGYVAKSASPATLMAAMRLVLDGEIYVPTFMAESGMATASRRLAVLTDRQRDVLRLVVSDKPNKEIGLRLKISEKTVKAHLTAIFAKLGVSNRTDAARIARDEFG